MSPSRMYSGSKSFSGSGARGIYSSYHKSIATHVMQMSSELDHAIVSGVLRSDQAIKIAKKLADITDTLHCYS